MSEQAEQQIIFLEEPSLEFAHNQKAIDPHDGLSLFGPFSKGTSEHPSSPNYIVLGTSNGLRLWQEWATAMNKPAYVPKIEKHRLWPPFPGYESAFGSAWLENAVKSFTIDEEPLTQASRKKDSHERCFAVVDLYLNNFKIAKKLDTPPVVAICIVPDEVWKNCRPESRVANPTDLGISKKKKDERKAGQLDLFERFDSEQYSFSPDFRRQLKARVMQYDIPIQIIRESTLRLSDDEGRGQRGLTPLSDRMWNLGTGLYYKSGGKPWKLDTREYVSYIGLAFKRTEDRGKSACCVAQMFLSSGDGMVFLGDEGPWYSEDDNQFHLTANAAEKLLKGVLETYSDLNDTAQPLQEIFLHCKSSIFRDEFEGYSKACPPETNLVGIRVRPDKHGPRFYRTGNMPVLRGTMLRVNERTSYLLGSGFKPRLGTYDGWEVPVPLRIDIQHGDASIETVTQDIFALTKLNFNACRLGEGQPVTVGFSEAVGEILLANPTVTNRKYQFKFYI